MKEMIGKTIGDLVSGKLTHAWESLSLEGKAACIVGGVIATAQFAMIMVYGKEHMEQITLRHEHEPKQRTQQRAARGG